MQVCRRTRLYYCSKAEATRTVRRSSNLYIMKRKLSIAKLYTLGLKYNTANGWKKFKVYLYVEKPFSNPLELTKPYYFLLFSMSYEKYKVSTWAQSHSNESAFLTAFVVQGNVHNTILAAHSFWSLNIFMFMDCIIIPIWLHAPIYGFLLYPLRRLTKLRHLIN